MAFLTGILSISMGNSRVNGTLLAIQNGLPNPLTAATNFLINQGFSDGDAVTVSGDGGLLGGVNVFFMTGASAAAVHENAMSELVGDTTNVTDDPLKKKERSAKKGTLAKSRPKNPGNKKSK